MLAVFGGALSGQFFKGHGKLRDIGESAGGGDIRDTDGGIAQQKFRVVYLFLQYIVERAHARLFFERVAEMVVRIPRKFRKISEIDVRSVLLVDIAQHGQKTVLRIGGVVLARQTEQKLPRQKRTHEIKVGFLVDRFVLYLFQKF